MRPRFELVQEWRATPTHPPAGCIDEPECAANRWNIDTGAEISYLDQLTLARIDVEPLETMTYDVVDW